MTKIVDSEHGLSIDLDEALILMNHMAELIKGYNSVLSSVAEMCAANTIYKQKSGAYVVRHLQDRLIKGLTVIRDDQMRIFDKTGQVMLDKNRVKNLIIKLNDLIELSHADAEKLKEARMMEMATAPLDKYTSMVIGDAVGSETTVVVDDVNVQSDLVKGPVTNSDGSNSNKDLVEQIKENYERAGIVPK